MAEKQSTNDFDFNLRSTSHREKRRRRQFISWKVNFFAISSEKKNAEKRRAERFSTFAHRVVSVWVEINRGRLWPPENQKRDFSILLILLANTTGGTVDRLTLVVCSSSSSLWIISQLNSIAREREGEEKLRSFWVIEINGWKFEYQKLTRESWWKFFQVHWSGARESSKTKCLQKNIYFSSLSFASRVNFEIFKITFFFVVDVISASSTHNWTLLSSNKSISFRVLSINCQVEWVHNCQSCSVSQSFSSLSINF